LNPNFGWAYARRAAVYESTDQPDKAQADRAKADELGAGDGRKF
jgi:hypothetical protein